MMIEYIAFDIETGGVDPSKNPVLTAYFSLLDKDLNLVDEIELKIKPSDKYNVVESDALRVNGIDLQKHLEDPSSLSPEQAGEKLLAFLDKHLEKKGKGHKPRPLGHNISFDLGFIPQLVDKKTWESYVHYGFVCTFSISSFLKAVGVLPPSIGNLGSLVKHFEVPQRLAHDAKQDTLACVDVYAKMVGMVKGMSENSGGVSVDLLSALEK